MTVTAPPPSALRTGQVEPSVVVPRRGFVRRRTAAAVLAVVTVVAYLLFRTDGAADSNDAAAFRFFDSVRDWPGRLELDNVNLISSC